MKITLAALLLIAFPTLAFAAKPGASLTVGATASGANLTWANPNVGTTINAYRCAGLTCTNFTLLASGISGAGPYLDTTVTSGSFSYQVRAVAQDGTLSPASNTATYTLAPLAPTGLSAN